MSGPVDILAARAELDGRFWTEASFTCLHVGWARRELDAAVERGEVERRETADGLVGYRYNQNYRKAPA